MASLHDITPDQAPIAREAATIVLMRDTDGEPEILLLRRHARSGFAANLWVFPGGVVDPTDATVDPAHWRGIDPERLADRFGMPPRSVLAMYVAALRETFEEAGVLLAHHRDGRQPDTSLPSFAEMREALNDRETSADWIGFLQQQDLVLDLDALTYHSRWITPIQEPRRYDTCFFIARMPEGAVASADNIETTEDRWLTARDALDSQDVPMIFPTIRTLETVVEAATTDQAAAIAAGQAQVPVIQPHMVLDPEGRLERILTTADPDYPHELYR